VLNKDDPILNRLTVSTRFKAQHIPWNSHRNLLTRMTTNLAMENDKIGTLFQMDLMHQTLHIHQHFLNQLDELIGQLPTIDSLSLQSWIVWTAVVLLRLLAKIGYEDIPGAYLVSTYDTSADFKKYDVFNLISLIGHHPFYDHTEASSTRWDTWSNIEWALDLTSFPEVDRPINDSLFLVFIKSWFERYKPRLAKVEATTSSPWETSEGLLVIERETFTLVLLRFFTLLEFLVKSVDLDISLPFWLNYDRVILDEKNMEIVLTAYSSTKVFIEYICFGVITNPISAILNQKAIVSKGGEWIFDPTTYQMSFSDNRGSVLLSIYPTDKNTNGLYWPTTISETLADLFVNKFGFITISRFGIKQNKSTNFALKLDFTTEYTKVFCKRFRLINYFIEDPDDDQKWYWNTLCSHRLTQLNGEDGLVFEDGLPMLIRLLHSSQENSFANPFFFPELDEEDKGDSMALCRYGCNTDFKDPIFTSLVETHLTSNMLTVLARITKLRGLFSRRLITIFIQIIITSNWVQLVQATSNILWKSTLDRFHQLIPLSPPWLTLFLSQKAELLLRKAITFHWPTLPEVKLEFTKSLRIITTIRPLTLENSILLWFQTIMPKHSAIDSDLSDEEFKLRVADFINSSVEEERDKIVFFGRMFTLTDPAQISKQYAKDTLLDIDQNLKYLHEIDHAEIEMELECYKFYRTCFWMGAQRDYAKDGHSFDFIKQLQKDFDKTTIANVRSYQYDPN
jgi:hypothetical protein